MNTHSLYNICGGVGLLAMTVAATSCDDFLDQYSQDLVVAKSVSDLNELLIGDVYLRSQDIGHGASNRTYGFVNILDDDIATTGTSATGNIANIAWSNVVAPLYGYYTWQQDVRYNYGRTNQQEDNKTWNTLYTRINHANNIIDIIDIIDGMPHKTHAEIALYHRVKGEAHFVRAQFYLALANLYSPAFAPDSAVTTLCVPLKLTPHVEHDKTKPTQFQRASQAEVYGSIVRDLTIAFDELTTSPQPDRYRLHRASAEAAGTLLSRVYLYMQQWEKAEEIARKVVSSSRCQIAGIAEIVPGEAFLKQGAKEILFSQGANHISPKDKGTSLSAAPGDFCVARDLYDSFSDNDVRKQAFFAPNSLSDSISLTTKYERGIAENHISDGFALRASEAHLNLVEALAMQPSKATEALTLLNAFRRQRIAAYTDTTVGGAALVKLVREERRRELCFEGHRWFDLRRYAVCKTYPYSKNILHPYNVYTGSNAFLATHYYQLPAGDPAYTFLIPPKVIEFDKIPMTNNVRFKREEYKFPTLPPVAPVSPSRSR